MATTGIARVRYFDRQFLRPGDFENEQAYHLAMRRRHNISEHTWGIVSGLTVQEDEGTLFLQPGFAIDGYGREIVLSQRRQLATEEFDRQRSEVLDVWIRYGRQDTDLPPKGYSGCGSAGEPHRSHESPVVRFEKPDLSYPNRRHPKLVPPSDYGFSATRIPPDEPEALWPVFLGQVTRGGTVDARTFTINPADRPYAGLVGESVVAPSGETRLQIGRGADPNDPPGFAVFVPAIVPQQGGASLQIDDQNHIMLRGDTEVAGDVAITKGALEFAITPDQPPGPAVVSPLPQPWKMYVAPNDQGGTDLCLEMARSTGVPNRVTVGTFSPDDKRYIPCLTVEEDCTVTVEKNLVVNGTITGPGGVVPDIVMQGFTKEARELLLSSMLTGVGGSAAVLGQFFRTSVPPTASTIAALLDSSPTETARFAALVKTQYPALATTLRELFR
jgi:hypothetical protein